MIPSTELGLTYVPRGQWGAQHGGGPKRREGQVVDLLVVHHSWRPSLTCGQERAQERAIVRSIERYHAITNGWKRIGYHWLIFQSGHVYEGLGWGRIGVHTAGQNSRSVGVCFVLNGDEEDPTPAAVESWSELREAAERAELQAGYLIRGHRDFSQKSCPGDRVYRAVVQAILTDEPTLRRGMVGPVVERAQRLLARIFPTIGIDGRFGLRTEDVVKSYQEREGLAIDGVVGPATWEKLRS